ncbi:MAG: tripartite tricarboxylate transporter substrate binding protein [Pseudomonadota bacterium]
MKKRHALIGSALMALAVVATAQTLPNRPVRLLVGAPPGGGNDQVARIVAQHMNLGQPVVIENRAGAASMIAADMAAKAPPDGSTLLLVSQSILTVSPILQKITAFDPQKDFTAVALIGSAPLVLVAGPSLKANSVKELIDLAKAKPGEIDFGSGGVGTTPYMAATLFGLMSNVSLNSIPYPGEQAAMLDIIGGRVPMMFGNAAAALPHVKSGKLRGLAITSPTRLSIAPDLPTVAESGVRGFEIGTWLGLVAPTGTPPATVNRIHAEVQRVLQLPDVQEKLQAQGFTTSRLTPAQFSEYIKSEHTKWSKVIKDANIKGE